MIERPLQRQSQALGRYISFRWDLINRSSKVMSAEEGLKEGVHVTGSALIFESDIASLLFRVVAVMQGDKMNTKPRTTPPLFEADFIRRLPLT